MFNISARLSSLLTVQETLAAATSVGSLTDVLPTVFKTILESTGSQNGRLLLLNRPYNEAIIVSANDGQVDIEALNPISKSLIEEVDSLNINPGQGSGYITPQDENYLLFKEPSVKTTTTGSEIIVPLQGENSTIGILSISKPMISQIEREDILQYLLFANQLTSAITGMQHKENWQKAEVRIEEISQDNRDLPAILVHDLQGPLGNVMTSLELLQAELGTEDDSTTSLMLDIAIRSSQALKALIYSLLDISRLEAGQKLTKIEPVAISDIVDYVAEIEKPVLEQRQVTIVRDFEPNLPLINVNIDILQRVLLNLFDNAIKVSKQNQIITVGAFVSEDDNQVQICVIDQGPGIPEEYHERIFEKYQRVETSSESKGLGLGLAFCKLALEAHGGQIWVENIPDQGACFCMMLPFENQVKSNK